MPGGCGAGLGSADLESQSQAGYDAVPQRQSSIYTGTRQGYRDRIATLNLGYTPIDGTRLSLFLRGQVAYFGYNTLGSPTFDDSNSTGQTDSVEGRIGGSTKLFNGIVESNAYVGQLNDDRQYLEPLAAADPNQVSSNSRYHSYQTDAQWNNVVHLDDFLPAPALSASALTFGYEYIGAQAKVRVNENFAGFLTSNPVPPTRQPMRSIPDCKQQSLNAWPLRDRYARTGSTRIPPPPGGWAEFSTPTKSIPISSSHTERHSRHHHCSTDTV